MTNIPVPDMQDWLDRYVDVDTFMRMEGCPIEVLCILLMDNPEYLPPYILRKARLYFSRVERTLNVYARQHFYDWDPRIDPFTSAPRPKGGSGYVHLLEFRDQFHLDNGKLFRLIALGRPGVRVRHLPSVYFRQADVEAWEREFGPKAKLALGSLAEHWGATV